MRTSFSKKFAVVLFSTVIAIAFFGVGCEQSKIPDGLPDGTSLESSYHPAGWASARTHGQDFLANTDSCSLCHGRHLDGGSSDISCNKCHSGWQENCTFCHGGGPDNPTAAPPYDLAGNDDASLLSVGAHEEHVVANGVSDPIDCAICHKVPTSLNAEGHLDDTAGAEVIFASFAGEGASYNEGTCSSVYCHGASEPGWASEAEMNCASCHGDDTDADDMSGNHAAHFTHGLTCTDCHNDVADENKEIKDTSLHVNGSISVALSLGDYDPESKTCSQTCHEDREWGGKVHPVGWFAKDQHGYAFESGESDCAACHGADFDGGTTGVSCDDCHTDATSAWRTTCTFCHGGTDNATGAPPEAVFGETATSEPAVGAHTAHVDETDWHAAFDCSQCHKSYSAFDDEGHIDQDGGAEVVFEPSGINASGAYASETASCSSVYCHGYNEIGWTSDPELNCTSCHGDETASDSMSGNHTAHLSRGFACADCHAEVVDRSKAFTNKSLHVNGSVSVSLSTGTFDPDSKTCSQTCHNDRVWGSEIHPTGWFAKDQHGYAFERGEDNCASCHGANLDGGSSGVSCDSCHTGGTDAWRTTCTFCHGGTDNDTGAPPESVFGETDRSVVGVGAHSAHVAESDIHVAFDCAECHMSYASFTDDGHIDQNGGAEVAFNPGGLNTSASYATDSATCSSLYCHGNGQVESGALVWTDDPEIGCSSCHGDETNSASMSGQHKKHLDDGNRCAACHKGVINNSGSFVNKGLHINGTPDVELLAGDWDPGARSCDTACHSGPRMW